MEDNTNLSQNVDTLFSNLEAFTQKEGLIGKPVTQGDKTFIPVVSVTLGFGSGNSAAKNQAGKNHAGQGVGSGTMSGHMAGGASGLGAKLCTDAIIVIDKDNVSMMQMNSMTANAGQLMDKIPQIISNMTQGKQSGSQQGAQQGSQQGQQ